MTSVLRQARKKRFQIKEEQRINQEIELQSYLNRLISVDAEKSLGKLKEKECQGNDEKKEQGNEDHTAETDVAIRKEIEEKRDTSINLLNELFAKVDDNRRVS